MSTTPSQDVPGIRDRIAVLIEAGDLEALEPLAAEMHPSDVADLVESLPGEERAEFIRILPAELASEALVEMEDGEGAADLLASLQPAEQAELIHELDVDDATDLVGDLEPADRAQLLAQLPAQEAGEIRDLLEYDEETAGGIMNTSLVSVPADITAGQAIDEVRILGREVEDFFMVFVVDADRRLIGTVPLDDLVLADPGDAVLSIVEPVAVSVTTDEDQEEVGKLMSRYNVVTVPVVDHEQRLLGRITFDDVIDVMEAEQTEDLLRFSGVSDEEEIRGGWADAVRGRLPWLLLHTVTLSIASAVILVFDQAIIQLPVLAFIMPIIAGLGGNAGTQALAVTVRRLATSGGPLEPKRGVVGKEVLVALSNGIVVAVAVSLIVAALSIADVSGAGTVPPVRLGVVVLIAMWGNVLVAGSAGALIPTVLHRLGADPAVASSVFLTTMTDLVGFFLLLGLAASILL